MKLHNLTLENFRSFDRYTINHLGRVNLLVGTNNSGKTSILEAIEILMADQRLEAIWSVLSRRGETHLSEDLLNAPSKFYETAEVRRLFHNHSLEIGINFRLSGNTTAGELSSDISIITTSDLLDDSGKSIPYKNLGVLRLNTPSQILVLKLDRSLGASHGPDFPNPLILLERDGGLSSKTYLLNRANTDEYTIKFVDTSLLTSSNVAEDFDKVVLTPAEDLVLEALRFIEPSIERIATAGLDGGRAVVHHRGGILMRVEGLKERVPIASMGNGVWRMLGLALGVVHSQNGILLIDEVDSGLHHSVMDKLWRFLDECSKRFNVQVIATTHSRDCYQSLAEICDADRKDPSEITMQRIDRKRNEAVAYSEAAIIAAAENDVEVR